MKLRNKKTGEIINLDNTHFIVTSRNDSIICCLQGTIIHYEYESLSDFANEWEDYEEPKGIQCIYYVNHFDAAKINGVIVGFGTKEEAEKAVEKLKAWKRLKDKGFRFNGWNGTRIGSNISYISEDYYEGCADDMDLLFGGEESEELDYVRK